MTQRKKGTQPMVFGRAEKELSEYFADFLPIHFDQCPNICNINVLTAGSLESVAHALGECFVCISVAAAIRIFAICT